jgi:cytochrome P450
LVRVGINPRVQEKLYQELSAAVEATEGKLTPDSLAKKNVPYLHACLKENYRLTPPFASAAFKRSSQGEVEIHGEVLPKDSMVMLKNKFNDPANLEDATEFKPERWMPEAAATRVGTPLEDMDHALFRDNFGQGARQCPGSRVATNEMLAMIAQLVLDYKIVPPSDVKTLEDVKYEMTLLICPHLPAFQFIPRHQETVSEELERAA